MCHMKTLFYAITVVALSSVANALALEIPRSTNRVEDLDKATEKATKGKKGILWVYTDPALQPT